MAKKHDTGLSHFDEHGKARMVDVGNKPETTRIAKATGSIKMSLWAFELVKGGSIAKGDVLGIARVAGIMAAKRVDTLIPLAHALLVSKIDIDFTYRDAETTIDIMVTVGTRAKTGVEMEALTGVSVAALTIYDMCKAVDKSMVISDICLMQKKGGKSGTYVWKQ